MINKVRKINSLVMITGLLYIVQNLTLGQLPVLNDTYIFRPILLKEILFLLTSILISLSFFRWNFSNNK